MKPRVLIGYSACPRTRQAFERAGCEAYTCDRLPARDGNTERHIIGDVWDAIRRGGWDFGLFHPMCTYLTVSAAWAFNDPDFDRYPGVGYHQKPKPGTLTGAARRAERDKAIENFDALLNLTFPVECENPGASFLSKALRPADQIVHPHQFGDDASKATGFWRNADVPPLVVDPSLAVAPRVVNGRPRWANQTDSGQNKLGPSDPNRWLKRSETYPGIAAALGAQRGAWLAGA